MHAVARRRSSTQLAAAAQYATELTRRPARPRSRRPRTPARRPKRTRRVRAAAARDERAADRRAAGRARRGSRPRPRRWWPPAESGRAVGGRRRAPALETAERRDGSELQQALDMAQAESRAGRQALRGSTRASVPGAAEARVHRGRKGRARRRRAPLRAVRARALRSDRAARSRRGGAAAQARRRRTWCRIYVADGPLLRRTHGASRTSRCPATRRRSASSRPTTPPTTA